MPHKPMYFFKQNKRGFTLIELLIAVAISAFIIASTYEILNSVIFTKRVIASQYLKSRLLDRLNLLLNKDFRESIENSYSYNEILDKKVFSFNTYHSLYFNNSMAVNVKYYTENDIDTDTTYLVREEDKDDMSFKMKIRLLPDIEDFKLLFYNGNEYSENFISNLKLFKVSFRWDKNSYEIPVGKIN